MPSYATDQAAVYLVDENLFMSALKYQLRAKEADKQELLYRGELQRHASRMMAHYDRPISY